MAERMKSGKGQPSRRASTCDPPARTACSGVESGAEGGGRGRRWMLPGGGGPAGSPRCFPKTAPKGVTAAAEFFFWPDERMDRPQEGVDPWQRRALDDELCLNSAAGGSERIIPEVTGPVDEENEWFTLSWHDEE